MPVFRVNKNANYTSMSNYHFKEKDMSLKAKGLLSLYFSLPNDWDFSAKGIASLCTEHEQTINKINQELERFNFLKRTRITDKKGKFVDWQYDIYEEPLTNFPQVEKPLTVNSLQLNTNILNTKELNIKRKIYKKKMFGFYKRILLTEEELKKLYSEFGQVVIDNQITLLDEYIQSNDNKNKYKDFNLVLRKSLRDGWFKNKRAKKDEILPSWFEQDVESEKLSKEEQEELESLLKEFR